MNISIEIKENESEVNVKLIGEIDAHTAPEVREALLQSAEENGMQMIIDLSEVSYMDSTGLGVFVGVFKSLTSKRRQFNLNGDVGSIEAVIRYYWTS